ncbi:MAG: hypothetical protein ACFE8Z_04155 [Candidatus Hermodarchaeota archaeon]
MPNSLAHVKTVVVHSSITDLLVFLENTQNTVRGNCVPHRAGKLWSVAAGTISTNLGD